MTDQQVAKAKADTVNAWGQFQFLLGSWARSTWAQYESLRVTVKGYRT